ncbi:iron-sulfur cluster co-chaperone protein HscB-like protein [Leptotrombidium deliense]|uniref:Iron-sulfur cluster co-chaperone protein HscB-like protein n=1 Tax=Leptotrombidium deliense TaxID=299467 RepID=A0A443SL74_9ACAR|nr:iron-sulfur cluster co-chaperone protein HscB-like protein [Leptotrombidium deliense]
MRHFASPADTRSALFATGVGSASNAIRVCNACRALQPFDARVTFYELFDEKKSFDVKNVVLNVKFKQMQKVLHPDKFATASERERELSSDYSSLVNKAYKVLVDPYERGLYLLCLHGKEVKEDSDIQLTPDFLMEVMEFNEAIADNKVSQETLKTLKVENDTKIEKIIKEISTAFEFTDFDSAKLLLAKLKFYNNAAEKIKEKLQ